VGVQAVMNNFNASTEVHISLLAASL